jgi:hypothetical protein
MLANQYSADLLGGFEKIFTSDVFGNTEVIEMRKFLLYCGSNNG